MTNAFTERLFEYRPVEKKKLIISLSITSVAMIVEVIGGILTNSIALISDAGHMFTHSFTIVISLIAIIIATKPPCHHRTFGLYRAEILAAFINGLFLLLVVGLIIFEGIRRIRHPEEILGIQMLLIALLGLFVNGVSILILQGAHKSDLNVRSVFYHMIADAASSVVIVFAAIVILYTGWTVLDPLVSLGISALILYWARGILKESGRILLEMAPLGLNSDIINDDLKRNFPDVKELYNAHLWTITPDILVFSAHVKLNDIYASADIQKKIIAGMNHYLTEKYRIIESTLQLTSAEES